MASGAKFVTLRQPSRRKPKRFAEKSLVLKPVHPKHCEFLLIFNSCPLHLAVTPPRLPSRLQLFEEEISCRHPVSWLKPGSILRLA
jgi:hypothetical protein